MPRDYLSMLCDVGDLGALIAGSHDIDDFLDRTVRLVSDHLDASVCSIYLYDADTRELILRATVGLNTDSTGKLRIPIDEGLVGMALRELRPIVETHASLNPQFKAIPDLNEEDYDAFLAVPIQRGIERVGVLVVQRHRRDPFDADHVQAIRVAASQVAGAIESARILIDAHRPDTNREQVAESWPELIHGRATVEGCAIGESMVPDRDPGRWLLHEVTFSRDFTIAEFDTAVRRTHDQLEALEGQIEGHLPEMSSLIFSAHQLMLMDDSFGNEMREKILQGANPPDAVIAVARHYIRIFEESENAYIREKAHDVADLTRRLIDNLVDPDREPAATGAGRILIVESPYPSDILEYAATGVEGLVVVGGGTTSHVSILTRSLELPTVLVNDRHLLRLPNHTPLLLDGATGCLYIEPARDVVERIQQQEQGRRALRTAVSADHEPVKTLDGVRVHMLASINLLGDLAITRNAGAEGIGLYRTEFAFFTRSDFPSEEVQVGIYRRIAEDMDGKPVTFRTLDVGGDKLLAYLEDRGREENPFMGLRSIRVSLRHPKIFRQQIRAILRATEAKTNTRILFPMISSVDEFMQARAMVETCVGELNREGHAGVSLPQLGPLIEIPSIIEVLDELAQHADFFSIGTNDLIQYVLAVDRTNDRVADYYLPHHPAVLRAIKRIADTGHRHGLEVAVCGEMAHQYPYVPFFIGAGIRHLSIDPHFLPRVGDQLRRISAAEAEAFAARLLECVTIRDAEEQLKAGVSLLPLEATA